jgi:acyl-[acyl carrier protein]--UDP-N-acetylglucosamine O-acyltransferase
MIIKNEKPLKIIGYAESTLTQESLFYGKNFVIEDTSLMTPQEFKQLDNKDDFQYFIGFALDLKEREQTIDLLDEYDSDCVTYVHDSAIVFEGATIGKGSCVANFSSLMAGAKVGNHCFIETYCLVSHETTVGKNCMFNFKSAAINNIEICDNVTLGAFSSATKSITKEGVYVGTPARFLR